MHRKQSGNVRSPLEKPFKHARAPRQTSKLMECFVKRSVFAQEGEVGNTVRSQLLLYVFSGVEEEHGSQDASQKKKAGK